ncbi:MAG: hypothetical protein AAF307_06175 [Pseudomonadota bacterium]
MKLSVTLALLLTLCAASSANAGAWLKERGSGFASFTLGGNMHHEVTGALYLEYGLGDHTTIGIDVNGFTDGNTARNALGHVFLRRELFKTGNAHRFSYEVGVGAMWLDERTLPTVKTTLSWGYGFSSGPRNGWASLDASYTYEPTLGMSIAKVDGTFGMAITEVTTGMIQFTASSQNDNDSYRAVEPSLLFTPKGKTFSLRIGAEVPVEHTDKSALKLGLWRRF